MAGLFSTELMPHLKSSGILLQQMLKFASVGVLNTLVGLSVIWLLIAFGMHVAASNAIGYAVGFVCSVSLNKRFTFASRESWLKVFLRFSLVTLVAYMANLFLVMWCIEKHRIDEYVAQLIGMPIYTLISFVGCRLYVFRSSVDDRSI